MDFSFTAEQDELRRAVRDLASDRSTSAQVRAVIDGPTGYDAELWRMVTDLGLPAMAVAEQHGGTGGSFIDAAVVLEEAGRSLLPVRLLSSLVATAGCADADLSAAVVRGDIAALAVGDP